MSPRGSIASMTDDVTTWHHGLIAQWWAQFNHGGPEIDFYRRWFAEGRPVLDAACGAGRLLVPWARSGVDIDGVDASADMIAACRAAMSDASLHPNLFVQPLHHLALPRRYGTIVVCGAYGLGGSTADDRAALERLRAHLLPGGTLILDYEIDEFDDDRLRHFSPAPPDPSPPTPEQRRRGNDGFDYALRPRMVAVDLHARQVFREMQAWKWSGDELLAHETHQLRTSIYTAAEITDALLAADFEDATVLGGFHDDPPGAGDQMHVWIAHAPA
jgi:SAM-dependent methyltransferase